MKRYHVLAICFLILSCKDKTTSSETTADTIILHEAVVPEFKAILDTAQVEGSILIYDLEADTYYSNDFNWTKNGKLPASTFKIPHSIIALETKVVVSDSTLFKWDGEPRRLQIWEQDLNFRDALQLSCVPCYQEVARQIGVKRMTAYLNKLNYGAINVNATNLDLFWLQGESQITQLQQIDFLKRLYQSQLNISKHTETIIKRMLVIEANEHYTLSGKTGWSIRHGNNNGWFVGYIQAKDKVYFFATNVEPKDGFDMALFPMIRKDVTDKAFEQIGILK